MIAYFGCGRDPCVESQLSIDQLLVIPAPLTSAPGPLGFNFIDNGWSLSHPSPYSAHSRAQLHLSFTFKVSPLLAQPYFLSFSEA